MSDSDDEVLSTRKVTKPKPNTASKAAVKKETNTNGAVSSNGKVANIKKEVDGDSKTNDKTSQAAKIKVEKPIKGENGTKAVKKFGMPGQTKETPPENDSLRKFYISLLSQKPNSDMAKKWCLQYGLLPLDEAEAYIAEMKAQKGGSTRTMVKKEAAPVKKESVTVKKESVVVKKEISRVKEEASTASNVKRSKNANGAVSKLKGGQASSSSTLRKGKNVAYSESESEEEEEEEILPSKKRSSSAPVPARSNGSASSKSGSTSSSKPIAAAKPAATARVPSAATKGNTNGGGAKRKAIASDSENESESDSEDDKPLAGKKAALSVAGNKKRVMKKLELDESSSDDDKPLGARGKR
mmetsp:Transcript_4720/g.8574  ORF Transcript_4720/g.8574 Transcript_4720/m.8574 type:complete len:355 (-) Transcript_4720:545-1609(-)